MARSRKGIEDVTPEDPAVPTAPPAKSLKDQIQKSRTRKKSFVMDLRVHSPASLGYLGIEGIDTAPALVRLAKVKGLDVIAVTDYYSGEFIDRITEAAKETSLTVIPGTVVRCQVGSCDDVTILCLFPEEYGKSGVEEFLLSLRIPRSSFGSKDHLINLEFEKILSIIDDRGGVALPTRMDKTPHRRAAIPQLVEHHGFRAFDLAYADSVKFFKERWPKIKFQLFSFSNANALAQVGSRIARVKMPNPNFLSIRDLVARDQLQHPR